MLVAFVLSHQDSNLGKQNQNLMCYHYTMGQDFLRKTGCKSTNILMNGKIFFAAMQSVTQYALKICVLKQIVRRRRAAM